MRKIFISIFVCAIALLIFVKSANAEYVDGNGVDITNYINGRSYSIDLDSLNMLDIYSNQTENSSYIFAKIEVTYVGSNTPLTVDLYVGNYDQFENVLMYSGGGGFTYLGYFGAGSWRYATFSVVNVSKFVITFNDDLSIFDVNTQLSYEQFLGISTLLSGSEFDLGVDSVLKNPNNFGLYTEEQMQQSFNDGKDEGYLEGVENASENSLYNTIMAVVDTPFRIFNNIFDFEVLGVNIANVVMSFVTLIIVIYLGKKLL